MDEGIAIRAISIGVSVLIAIATMSVVMTYYSTAQETVRNIGKGTNLNATYNTQIQGILIKESSDFKVTGTEVKSLINYFYMNQDVDITIQKLMVVDSSGNTVYETMSGANIAMYQNINNDKDKYNNVLKKILPNQKFSLQRIVDGAKTYIYIISK